MKGRAPPGPKRGPCQGLVQLGSIGSGNAGLLSRGAAGTQAAAAYRAEARFRRDVERVHSLGPRVLLELLAELGRERLMRTVMEAKVSKYASRLDPDVLRALGADRFPAGPIRVLGKP
jgi:hypothetical protein